jgi:hypothetical protein
VTAKMFNWMQKNAGWLVLVGSLVGGGLWHESSSRTTHEMKFLSIEARINTMEATTSATASSSAQTKWIVDAHEKSISELNKEMKQLVASFGDIRVDLRATAENLRATNESVKAALEMLKQHKDTK